MKKKKLEKNNSGIVKVDKKKKEIWVGSVQLMGTVVPGSKEAKERMLIKMVAEVLEVSPFGVNILGNVPYINRLGLEQKSEQYGKGKDKFIYNWIKRAHDEADKAICECKIVRGKEDLTDWVTGECSPSTMKMGTLKGYQNHMAQTRAKNRAIKEAYGVRIHTDMIANIGKALQQKNLSETQAQALLETAGQSTSTSADEVELDKKDKVAPIRNDLFIAPAVNSSTPKSKQDILVCQNCDGIISQAGADFSKRLYGKHLCKECVTLLKPKQLKK